MFGWLLVYLSENLINQKYYILAKDTVTFVFTFAGLVIAGMGLATWRKKIKGTKEFETAYDLHYSLLKLRNAIKHVRHHAIFPSEENKAIQYSKEKYPNESDENIIKNSHAYVYEMRWEKIIDAQTKVESHLLSAEVLWGSDILDLIKPLNKKIIELNINLKQHFQPLLRTKDYADIDDVIYGRLDNDGKDTFSVDVNQAMQKIIEYIKSKM